MKAPLKAGDTEISYANGLLDFHSPQTFDAITLSVFFRVLGITMEDCQQALAQKEGEDEREERKE